MRVLIACEFSGIVRDAFRARGHDAWSCDFEETEKPGPHFKGDVKRFLSKDIMVTSEDYPNDLFCSETCVSLRKQEEDDEQPKYPDW